MKKFFIATVVVVLLLLAGVYYLAYYPLGKSSGLGTYTHSNQYNIDKRRFNNPEGFVFKGPENGFHLWRDYWKDRKLRQPPNPLPQQALQLKPQKSQSLLFSWLGHSSVLLELQGQRLLFDPMLGQYASPVPGIVKRFQPAVLAADQFKDVDAVIISHDHYDHLDYPSIKTLAINNPQLQFFVPLGVGAHLAFWGIDSSRINEMDWWQSQTFNGLQITCTPAQHFSGRGLWNRNSTLWASWVVKVGGDSVFFSGDSGYGPHYQKIGERLGPFTIAFLENGAYSKYWQAVHQLPEQGVQASIELKAKTMVPIHWAMFNLALHAWDEPIKRVTQAAKQQGVMLITPQIGEVVQPEGYQPAAWWLN